MRAGLLKYTLVFEEPVEEKTETGFIRKDYREVFRCRAYRKNRRFSLLTRVLTSSLSVRQQSCKFGNIRKLSMVVV